MVIDNSAESTVADGKSPSAEWVPSKKFLVLIGLSFEAEITFQTVFRGKKKESGNRFLLLFCFGVAVIPPLSN